MDNFTINFNEGLCFSSNNLNKYSHGKIYKIECHRCKSFYVGSTSETELSRRLSLHKSDSRKPTNKGVLLYKHVAQCGGWDECSIDLIESYPCNTREELHTREYEHKARLNPTLNKLNPIDQNAGRKASHKKQHTKNLLTKKYHCFECNKSYQSRDHLFRHRANKHITKALPADFVVNL